MLGGIGGGVMGKRTTESYKTNAREEGRIWSWPEEQMPEWEQGFPMQSLVCPRALSCLPRVRVQHPLVGRDCLCHPHTFFHPDPS